MRIEKVIGMGEETFFPGLIKKFGFSRYKAGDENEPLFVYGCNRRQKQRIMKHKGLCVILWTGSDTLRLYQDMQFIDYCKKNENRVFHLTFSHWCKIDLEYFGLKYRHKLIISTDTSNFQYEGLSAKKLYHYHSLRKPAYYGTTLVREMEERRAFPQEVIYAHYGSYTNIVEVYRQAYLGLRLTEHDGIANSVIEMGLMGKRSIYNGKMPCAIHYYKDCYKTFNPSINNDRLNDNKRLQDEVTRIILETYETQQQPDELLAEEMREFIYDDRKWLDTKYYTE